MRRSVSFKPWMRAVLMGLAAAAIVVVGVAAWAARSFDSARLQRAASEWMRANHDRELGFDGPASLRFWPQLAVAVQRVRLSEPGRPDETFATLEEAALALRLRPLLFDRVVEVERVTARGMRVQLRRDAEGRRNIDDLLNRAAAGEPSQAPRSVTLDSIELIDAELRVDDAAAGLRGTFTLQRATLDRVGPGQLSPVQLVARAELQEPPLAAAVELQAGLELQPAPVPGATPSVRLAAARLVLRGSGLGFDDLDTELLADQIRFGSTSSRSVADGSIELDGLQLNFSGTQFGWRVDAGQLALARLRFDVRNRALELDRLGLQLRGQHVQTTLDAELKWPSLKVVGSNLQGAAIDGRVQLGGDRQLLLRLNSAPPSGAFERITVPQLAAEVDGQDGSSTLRGSAEATLVIEPAPLAVALAPLSLTLEIRGPGLVPLRLALTGSAQLSDTAGRGKIEGTINEQRFTASIDADLDRPLASVNVDASFGTLDLTRFVAPRTRTTAAATAAPMNLRPLQRADGRLRLQAAQLLWPPYRIDGLDLQASVTGGVLDVQRLAGRAWGGRFDAGGRVDAGNSALSLRLRASDVDLRGLLTDTLGFDGLRGRGRVDADLRSRGITADAVRAGLNGRVALALRPAALRGIDLAQTLRSWRTAPQGGSTTVASDAARQTDFTRLDATFELRNGVAHTTDLDGESEFLRLGGEGSIDFVRSRLDSLLRARVVNTAGGRAGPEMVLLNGVTLPIELRGPFGAVEWQVNWPSVTAGVAMRSVPNIARGAGGAVGGVLRGTVGAVQGGRGARPAQPASPSNPPVRP